MNVPDASGLKKYDVDKPIIFCGANKIHVKNNIISDTKELKNIFFLLSGKSIIKVINITATYMKLLSFVNKQAINKGPVKKSQ